MESPAANAPSALSLAGSWHLALDRRDAGVGEGWFARPLPDPQSGNLPGSLAVQGIGQEVSVQTAWTGTIFDRSFFESPDNARYRVPGNVKLPFLLQPEKVFVGAAWYQREIEIPAAWGGRRLVLTLERPHWQTRAWLDDRELGAGDSLSTPHEFDLGSGVGPGPHRLTLRVDNRLHIAVGENAHSVSDHTQGNWNGVVGRVELAATAPVWIDEVKVFPRIASRSIVVRGTVRARPGQGLPATVALAVEPGGVTAEAPLAADGAFEANLGLGADAPLWDEFTPSLHQLTVTLPNGERRTTGFGLREITTEGTQFLLNGRPVFFRGTVDCCVFPRTGHPPMDPEAWRRILRTVRAHGLNHIRFHSWCPPEAAFLAGDELGVYFQVEAATWPNSAVVLGAAAPAGLGDGWTVDAWTLAEAERIVRAYGNHPCFVLMAAGNEPGGPQHRDYLARWVGHMRARDSRRLYTGAAGWPELPENQFHVLPEPRTHQWGDGLNSRLNARPPATTADYHETVARRTVPVIAHESGQWCSYPPLHLTGKFTGHLRPHNFEIFADSLAAHHLTDQVRDFVHASGRLQALCYKEELESALRTPGLGGFQLLSLQDYPGQGTAPVGVLDTLGEGKGYLAPGSFRRFCDATVPLARLPRRVFTTSDTLEVDIETAHYGASLLPATTAVWQLTSDAGRTVLSGRLPPRLLEPGTVTHHGRLMLSLRHVPAPARYRLAVQLEGTSFANDWDVWVYPVVPALPAARSDVIITSSLSAAETALGNGGRVLLCLPPAQVRGGIALGFTPVFWNTWCTRRQAPHTLGLLCDPAHPALGDFPTNTHSNWQWWHLVSRAGALVLDELPPGLRPVVQVIDDWYTNRRLGLVFEARVGPGRLLVCSIDLPAAAALDPVARQLHASLQCYVASEAFTPATEVAFAAVRGLVTA